MSLYNFVLVKLSIINMTLSLMHPAIFQYILKRIQALLVILLLYKLNNELISYM